jgi:hypothetical protein
MKRYEYMRIPINSIPSAVITHYKLQQLVHNGNVYVEIRKEMYGLPQSGRLANDALFAHLKQSSNTVTTNVNSHMVFSNTTHDQSPSA